MAQHEFALDPPPRREYAPEWLDTGACVVRGYAAEHAAEMIAGIRHIACAAPFRRMPTPGGGMMSVAMTCCGVAGWCSDAQGYRYMARDPRTDRPWPPLPDAWRALAAGVAARAGYAGFVPDICLVNGYRPGARMGLHQDRDERLDAPVVSLSFGLPALFLWGGLQRTDPCQRIPLLHGDVVVWGGPSRLVFHGIAALRAGHHPVTGPCRYNLPFRRLGA